VDFGSQMEPVIPIHEGMYDVIKSADIILVDLTGHRPNVCVESPARLRSPEKLGPVVKEILREATTERR
jgi:hypothetical protein